MRFGDDYNEDDPFARAIRGEMANYTSPVQGSIAPSPDQPTADPIYTNPGYDPSVQPTNESYVPPAEQGGQMSVSNPEPPQPYTQTQTAGPPPLTAEQIGNAGQGFNTTWNPGGTAPTNAPPGYRWDPVYATFVKDAQAGPSDPFAFIRQWQQANPASQGIGPLADAISRQFPGVSRFMYGQTPSNNELSINGQKFKVLGAEDSPSTAYWYQGGNDSAPAGSRAVPAPRSSSSGFGNLDQGFGVGGDLINSLVSRLLGGGGIFAGLPSGASSGASQDPFRAQLMDALSKLISEGQTPVGDVSNTPQARAFQLASTRNAEKQRSRLAEQRGAQGLLRSGTFEQDKNAVDQQRSMAQSGYEAQLANTILEDRKQKLEYALSTGAAYISQEQQQQLQRELQGINAALAQTSIQLQLAQALLGNQRFYDQLGLQVGQTEAGLNQNAANPIFG